MIRSASVFSVVVLFAGSGCIHAHAKSELPPLDVPEPPPRIVETSDVEAPPPIGLIQEPGRNLPPGAARPSPAPPRADAPRPEAPKPEAQAPVEGPKPLEEGPKPPAAATLQTAPAQQEAELEGKIRTQLTRAANDLSRIDYSRLNANARTQYDSAKRFISLSEDALRAKNLVYAGTLADKAAELASQLGGR
jgi:hypothetical protein